MSSLTPMPMQFNLKAVRSRVALQMRRQLLVILQQNPEAEKAVRISIAN